MDRTAARARAMGIDVEPGNLKRGFACVLPGHAHVARLHPAGRYWHYRCNAAARSYELAEVRAFQGYGHPLALSRLERARWLELLDFEAGLLDRGPSPIPLPPNASAATTRIGEAWRLLVGLRDPDVWPATEPFVFARRFVIARASVSDWEARVGVDELEGFGSMVRVGRRGRSILWRPGPTLAMVLGSEDAAVEAVKAAFDGTEVAE